MQKNDTALRATLMTTFESWHHAAPCAPRTCAGYSELALWGRRCGRLPLAAPLRDPLPPSCSVQLPPTAPVRAFFIPGACSGLGVHHTCSLSAHCLSNEHIQGSWRIGADVCICVRHAFTALSPQHAPCVVAASLQAPLCSSEQGH